MPYAYGDYILTCGEITCQSLGLDRKKTVRKTVFFLGSPNWVNEYKTIDNRFYEVKSTECEKIEPSKRRR